MHNQTVVVEILLVTECPNADVARSNVDAALALLEPKIPGGTIAVHTTMVRNHEEAQERDFVGSPTFLIDGVDPFGAANQQPGLSCRIYQYEGKITAVPTPAMLADAIAARLAQ
ncbi:hypothetical protein IEU95_07490 [Hoyosella rhizosphaerae]|uniref:Thioredoxin family protein n=1 Tax=Hoyosella rhizosphaerae TaxID=1755582 RepID=A0A916U1W0_9ACTN|nr:hypothetical protein [Hoyosella rhizosphaerae]MBN4926667.1 hypothetical protein [Hoyosella rhizosphaerae]GGC57413.1 hypothetical protein GCM10011410_07400 [Hoyosella rhizosphaerae]